MDNHDKNIRKQESHGSVASYTVGFLLSIALTIAAFLLVEVHVQSNHLEISHSVLIPILASLAIGQFLVQLLFFLHLGTETKPRWKLVVLLFMLLVVSILVFGSLWIMYNLNYNMNTPTDVNLYLYNQDGL